MKKNIQEGVKRATKKIKEEESREAKSKPAKLTLQGTGSAGEGQATPSTPAKPIPRLTPAERAAGEARRAEREKNGGKPIIPLGTLAGHIKEAASRVGPEGRIAPDSDKVFISHAHKEFAKTPHGKGMSLDEFKNNLKLMNTNRHLDLSRADLVEAMNPDDVKESETLHKPMGNQGSASSFHFLHAPGKGRPVGESQVGQTGKPSQAGQPEATPYEKRVASNIEERSSQLSSLSRDQLSPIARKLGVPMHQNMQDTAQDIAGEISKNPRHGDAFWEKEVGPILGRSAKPAEGATQGEGGRAGRDGTPATKSGGSGESPTPSSTPPRKIKLAGKSPAQRRAVIAVANALQARQAFNEAKGRGDGEETLNSLRERANSLSRAAQPHLKAARKEGKMAGEAPGPKIAEGTAKGQPAASKAEGQPKAPEKTAKAPEKPSTPPSPLSSLGSPTPAKPEAQAKPVGAPSAPAKSATPPATPPVAAAPPKPAATATPKAPPKPASPTPSRDRSPGAAASRIQSRVRTALENVGRHPDNLQARKAMDRLRGRDLQASGILRAKEAGQSGYFGKLKGMRESGRSAPGVTTPPPAPAPSLPTVPYEGPGKGPVPSVGGQAKPVAASPVSPAPPASPASPAPSRALNPSEMSRSDNLYRSANESQLHTLASRVKAPLPPSTGDPFKDRQLLADSITRTIHDNPNLGDRAWDKEVSPLLPAQLSDTEAEARQRQAAYAERAPGRGASYKSGNKNVHY